MIRTFLVLFLAACGGEEAPPPPVAVSTEALQVDQPQSIESVLAENRQLIETCYQNELRDQPKLAGRIEFEWQVENNRAIGGQVVSSDFPEDADTESLATCVIEGAKRWHFPSGDGSVRYPITFSPET